MKSQKRHLYGLIFTLIFTSIILFTYRHWGLDVPLTDTETVNSWVVEANLKFHATAKPVKARFTIPYLPPYFAILDEYFVSHNYGVTTNLEGYNRETVWSLRRAQGAQSLYYRAIFRETDNPESPLGKAPVVKVMPLSDNMQAAVQALTSTIRQSSADIQTFAQETIKVLNKQEGNAKLLTNGDTSDGSIIKAAILVLNQARIFAMPVEGVFLRQQAKADLKTLLVIYNGKQWLYINPKTASLGLPHNFVIWHYGSDEIYHLEGGSKPVFNVSISPAPVNALSIAKTRGMQTDSQMLRFSLLQLPVQTQQLYKILLTVPIGAFIILLLRNFIGLKTFGTFMPVLIALAFRETHVVLGTALFVFIVSTGLLARFYLDQLQLLLVPRLAAILTIVVIIMIFITVIGQNLGLQNALSVALFPMVILTMTIERMCITWDERGPLEAIRSALGSLVAAIIANWAMGIAALQYLIFAFPELLLLVLALILWFGQYRGYRLSELKRFKALRTR